MDKKTLLKRYKQIGSGLVKQGRGLQIKYLKECMEMIENSFDPEFDGRHALVQRLNKLNEERMDCMDKNKQVLYAEAMNVVAACLASFQEVKCQQ
jgi:hypothetical protein